MVFWKKYTDAMLTAQNEFMMREAAHIEEAAQRITDSLLQDGVVHLFGTGHSSIPLQEAFYRSGGLAPVDAMLDPNMGMTYGAERCSALEKIEGFASKFVLPNYDLRAGEVIIIYSTSGRNPAVIETALTAKAKGLYVIGVTSLQIAEKYPSRHSSGKRLCDVADLVFDLDVPEGDVIVPISARPELGATGGASTMLAILLTNAILAQVVENFVTAGKTPPTLLCPNVGDAAAIMATNQKTMDRYRERIRHA